MITLMVISAYLAAITFVCGFLGSTNELPFGVDSFMINAVHHWNAFLNDFWPLIPIWETFLVYIVFRGSLQLVKLLFGHRFHHIGPAQ